MALVSRVGWSVPLFLLGAAAAAASIWWQGGVPAPPPLEADWVATARVLAGDGTAAWRDGDAARAHFSDPFGVAIHTDGTVYVADAGDAQRIRGISPDGTVFTLAGSVHGFQDGAGAAARFSTPSGLAIDSTGALYVADTGNNAVRRVSADGRVTTLAGDGVAGMRDGPGHEARFNGPIAVAVAPTGRVIVADTYNDRVRAIDPDGTVRTLSGFAGPGALDGTAHEARFHTPCGVAVDALGNIYVADTGNGLLRIIGTGGSVTTHAAAFPEGLVRPIGIAASPAGDIYVTDDRGRVLEVAVGRAARTLVGSSPGFRDGEGSEARFRGPRGLAFVSPARLIVADTGNALLRMVSAQSQLDFRPPPAPSIAPRFDASRFGQHPLLWPIAPMGGPHEVAGTLGEARGEEGTGRFHAGLDVRAEEGTPVRAVRDSVVSHPIASDEFGSLNEWIRIGPISYVHLRAGRTSRERPFEDLRFVSTVDEEGKLVRMRLKRGARFATGEEIGTVNRFNHVHLNVGWSGEEHNPLGFRLPQFVDTVRPTIARGGVRLYDEQGQRLTRVEKRRVVVSGRVQVVVDAWDQADGNRPDRRLGLYALGYEVLAADGPRIVESARDAIRFDQNSPDPNAPRLVYAPGSGIPFYGRRRTRFLYIVTNRLQRGIPSQHFWDTTPLEPGNYTLRITAMDIGANAALANRDLAVSVLAPPEVGGK